MSEPYWSDPSARLTYRKALAAYLETQNDYRKSLLETTLHSALGYQNDAMHYPAIAEKQRQRAVSCFSRAVSLGFIDC